MIEYAGVEFANSSSQKKQKNKKQDNFDHKQAANKIKCSEASHRSKKYKKIIFCLKEK